MMRWIVRSSLRYRYLVLAAAAAMMAIGLVRLQNVPVDVFPEFAPPRVEIQTIAIGMSTTEVEELITVPLEQALAGVEGLDVLRSKSVAQLSSILLIFKPGTDLLHARQLVAERIQVVTPSLPTWAAPPFMLQPLSATSRVMKIGMLVGHRRHVRPVEDRVLDIRSRLLQRRRASRTSRSGASGSTSSRSRSSPSSSPATGSRSTRSWRRPREALDAGLLLFSTGNDDRDRRLRRHREPAARDRARPVGRRAFGARTT